MQPDACCAPPEAPGAAMRALALEDELDDPTMSACCRRDALEQRAVERAKAALMAVDRVDARTRLERAVIAAAPPQPEEAGASDLEDDLADDSAMEQFRRRRLEQLQREGRLRQEAGAAGLGRLTQVTEAQAMEGLREQDGVTVIHLTEDGTAAGHDLDEHLEVLASRQRGVRFLRVPLARRSRLPPSLGLPHAPALLVFRDGALTAKALTAQFVADGSLLEERVTAWLRQPTRAAGEAAGGDDGSDGSSGESEEEQEDWREPCEICGRRYFHQHIAPKPLYQADGRQGAGSDSDGG